MVNMAVILDGSINEDNVQEIIDIIMNKYLESDDLALSSMKKEYRKKYIKERYEEYKELVPYDEMGLDSFKEFAEEIFNVLGFVGDYPIIMSYNPESLFDSFEIEDIYRKYEIDIYDIVENIDFLVTKSGILYENENYISTPNKDFVKILNKCNYSDYIVIIVGHD